MPITALPPEVLLMIAEELPPEYFCLLLQCSQHTKIRIPVLRHFLQAALPTHLSRWEGTKSSFFAHHLTTTLPATKIDCFECDLYLFSGHTLVCKEGDYLMLCDVRTGWWTQAQCFGVTHLILSDTLVGVAVDDDYFACPHKDFGSLEDDFEDLDWNHCPGLLAVAASRTVAALGSLHDKLIIHHEGDTISTDLDKSGLHGLALEDDTIWVFTVSSGEQACLRVKGFHLDGRPITDLIENYICTKDSKAKATRLQVIPTGVQYRWQLVTLQDQYESTSFVIDISKNAIHKIPRCMGIWKDRSFHANDDKLMSTAHEGGYKHSMECSTSTGLLISQSCLIKVVDDWVAHSADDHVLTVFALDDIDQENFESGHRLLDL